MAKGGRRLTDEAKSKTLLKVSASTSGKRLEKDIDKSQLSFSFQYFRQIPCFQLGEQDNKWFVSVLDRLKDLSGRDSSLMADATAKKSLPFTSYCLDPAKHTRQEGQPRAVDGKHIGLAQRIIWLDEELVEVFQKYEIETWAEKLEELLMQEL